MKTAFPCHYHSITDIGRMHSVTIARADVPAARHSLERLVGKRALRVVWPCTARIVPGKVTEHPSTIVWKRFFGRFSFSVTLDGEWYGLTAEQMKSICDMLAQMEDPTFRSPDIRIANSEHLTILLPKEERIAPSIAEG